VKSTGINKRVPDVFSAINTENIIGILN